MGKVGVAVDSLKDYEIIFEGIPLDNIGGTLQNDILKEYLARGTQIFPPAPSLRLIGDIVEYCYKNVPKFNTISICGYHMREAGCSLVQEVAYCLSDAIVYVEEVLKRGIDIDDFAPRLSFLLCCGMNLFEEVAKFRAARRLWAKIVRGRFNAKNPRSMMLRMFSGCSASAFTSREPLRRDLILNCTGQIQR